MLDVLQVDVLLALKASLNSKYKPAVTRARRLPSRIAAILQAARASVIAAPLAMRSFEVWGPEARLKLFVAPRGTS